MWPKCIFFNNRFCCGISNGADVDSFVPVCRRREEEEEEEEERGIFAEAEDLVLEAVYSRADNY